MLALLVFHAIYIWLFGTITLNTCPPCPSSNKVAKMLVATISNPQNIDSVHVLPLWHNLMLM
jgi:hypothetical protein